MQLVVWCRRVLGPLRTTCPTLWELRAHNRAWAFNLMPSVADGIGERVRHHIRLLLVVDFLWAEPCLDFVAVFALLLTN